MIMQEGKKGLASHHRTRNGYQREPLEAMYTNSHALTMPLGKWCMCFHVVFVDSNENGIALTERRDLLMQELGFIGILLFGISHQRIEENQKRMSMTVQSQRAYDVPYLDWRCNEPANS